jgi:hypothetical protein
MVGNRPVSGQLAAGVNKVQSIRENAMCDKKGGCQKPEVLKGKPRECPPEQIKECHGDAKGHPCVKRDDDK